MDWSQMNNRRNSTLIATGIGIAFVVIILIQFFSLSNPSTYERKVARERELKDLQFRNSPDSPIPREERPDFEGLHYFTPKEAYKVPAEWIADEKPDTIYVPTSTGELDPLFQAGKLHFTLQGRKQTLTTFQYIRGDRRVLFVPFRDLTTSVSTYGGGRYMEIPVKDPLEVDFNSAYNPYCVYNPTYSCPIPPPENTLQLEILAGEKMYGTPAAP